VPQQENVNDVRANWCKRSICIRSVNLGGYKLIEINRLSAICVILMKAGTRIPQLELSKGMVMPVPAVYAKLSSRMRRLKDDESGNVAVIFTLALLPLLGLVGAAVDYSHANFHQGCDAGGDRRNALKVAKAAGTLSDTQLSQQATDNFSALFTRPETTGVQIGAQYDTASKSLSLTATGSMKTDFMVCWDFPISLSRRVRSPSPSAPGQPACLSLTPLPTGPLLFRAVTMSILLVAACMLTPTADSRSA